jgi:hypothetical protein
MSIFRVSRTLLLSAVGFYSGPYCTDSSIHSFLRAFYKAAERQNKEREAFL